MRTGYVVCKRGTHPEFDIFTVRNEVAKVMFFTHVCQSFCSRGEGGCKPTPKEEVEESCMGVSRPTVEHPRGKLRGLAVGVSRLTPPGGVYPGGVCPGRCLPRGVSEQTPPPS